MQAKESIKSTVEHRKTTHGRDITVDPDSFKAFKTRGDVFKAKDELLKASSLYQDGFFEPPENETWVRPTVINRCVQNVAIHNGALVGAFATICLRKELVARLCPDAQNFSKNYCGLFYFQFWHFGEWEIVVIDDRLPYCSSKKKLLRLRSVRQDEFFFSLLEKAYAKFIGGYEALASVKSGDVLVDLTGGVSETWTLSKKNMSEWFPIIEKLVKSQHPATANLLRLNESSGAFDSKTTYVIKDIVSIDFIEDSRTVRLVKLADPLGKLRAYTGEWNNEAPEWRKVPQHLREKLAPKNDGSAGAVYEFWMTFYDFMTIFTYVQFCVLSPSQMGPTEDGVRWDLTTFKGQFPRYIPTASNIHSTASTLYEIYPQYVVELTDVDNFNQDGNCELVVSLLQKTCNSRLMKMGFSFYPLLRSKDKPPLRQSFFEDNFEAARSPISSSREIVCRLRLRPGKYVMIVLTTSQFKQREFLVRIYRHRRYNIFGHVIEYLNELTPERKNKIPPSSRAAPIGPYDGPTSRKHASNELVRQSPESKEEVRRAVGSKEDVKKTHSSKEHVGKTSKDSVGKAHISEEAPGKTRSSTVGIRKSLASTRNKH